MILEQKIKNYTPTEQTIDVVQKAHIVLLVGIAGAGKDTLKQLLLKNDDYRDVVSHTTRSPRANDGVQEIDGTDYHFINTEQAVAMIDAQQFIEVKLVHGDTVYGTSVAEIETGLKEDKISITDVDVQGIHEYKQLSSDVLALFIIPPDYQTWHERLSRRYETQEEFATEWPKRRASAIAELEHALNVPYYHFIINDSVDRAVGVINDIAQRPEAFTREDDEARLVARDLLDAIKAHN